MKIWYPVRNLAEQHCHFLLNDTPFGIRKAFPMRAQCFSKGSEKLFFGHYGDVQSISQCVKVIHPYAAAPEVIRVIRFEFLCETAVAVFTHGVTNAVTVIV